MTWRGDPDFESVPFIPSKPNPNRPNGHAPDDPGLWAYDDDPGPDAEPQTEPHPHDDRFYDRNPQPGAGPFKNGNSGGDAKLPGGRRRDGVPLTPAPALPFKITDWDARTVFAGEAPPQKWLIGGSIPLGVAGVVAAAGDTGKSFTALDLCLQVSGGPRARVIPELPILGGFVQNYGAAVFFTSEDGKDSAHRRIRALDPDYQRQERRDYPFYMLPLPAAGGPFAIVAEERGRIVATPQFEDMRRQLRTISDLALVVIDPLQCFVHADINADPQAAAMTMALLNMVAAETGAAVVVMHHVRKEREAPKNAQEARYMIRGTSAIVDQSRFAVVIWVPDEPVTRKICKTLGADYSPTAIVHDAVVKSNDGASRKQWTALRGPNGVLRDVTATLANRAEPTVELVTAMVDAIAAASRDGRPFTRTGGSGLFERRSELGEAFADVAKHQIAKVADDLLQTQKIVQALAAGSTTVKWLDVPGGPFALGEGEFAAGAGTAKPGRRRAGNGR